jgi:hypothetical protein
MATTVIKAVAHRGSQCHDGAEAVLLLLLLLHVLLGAVIGQAQKQLLDDEKREDLWKVLEMARGQ